MAGSRAACDLLLLAALEESESAGGPGMPVCQDRYCDPGRKVSGNSDMDSILTLRSPVPDVQLEYTPT